MDGIFITNHYHCEDRFTLLVQLRQRGFLVKMPTRTKQLFVIFLVIATYIKQCHGIGKNTSLTKEIGDAAMHTNKTFVVNCKGSCSDITVNVTVDTGGPNLYASEDQPPQRGDIMLLILFNIITKSASCCRML